MIIRKPVLEDAERLVRIFLEFDTESSLGEAYELAIGLAEKMKKLT